jgi:hypothetical protein
MLSSIRPDEDLAPLERLPQEIIENVAGELNGYPVKNVRLVSKAMAEKITGPLFRQFFLSPEDNTVHKLNCIVKSPIKDHIQHIVFDIPMVTASIYDIYGDCLAVDSQGDCCLGGIQLLKDFSGLANVHKITVSGAGWEYSYSFDRKKLFDEATLFYNILNLVRELKRPLSQFSITNSDLSTLSFDMFDLRDRESAHLEHGTTLHPPTVPNIADMQMQTSLPAMSGIKHLTLKLYSGRNNRLATVSANLRVALELMSANLVFLSFTILASGSHDQVGRSSCLDHQARHGNHNASLNFDTLLQDISFKSLKNLRLQDMLATPKAVGLFLDRHVDVLQKFCFAQWRCLPHMFDESFAKTLAKAAGPALHLLTIEASRSPTDRICLSYYWPEGRDEDLPTWSWYYEVPATLLCSLLLEEKTSQVAALHTLRYPCYTHRYDSRLHLETRERELPKHVKHLSQLSVSELASRGRWTEDLLQQYCDDRHTESPKLPSCQHTLDDIRKGHPCKGDGMMFVLVVNGEPGLYYWTDNGPHGYWNRTRVFKKWDHVVCERTLEETGRAVLGSEKNWCSTPETKFFNQMSNAKYGPDWLSNPVAYKDSLEYKLVTPPERDLFCTSHLAWHVQELWDIRRAFYFEIDDLPRKREERLRQAELDHAEFVRRREEEEESDRRWRAKCRTSDRAQKIRQWQECQAQRLHDRSFRRSRRHWEWVARRHERS